MQVLCQIDTKITIKKFLKTCLTIFVSLWYTIKYQNDTVLTGGDYVRDWLKQIRTLSGQTQEQVSRRAEISRAYYTRIENGKRGKPLPVDTAKKIAAELGFDWTRFFEESDT